MPWLSGIRNSPRPFRKRLLVSSVRDRIGLEMWLKRLFGRGEEASPGGQAPSTKEKEQGREDAQKDFMDEQARQRDEDSRMQDEGGS